MRNWAFFMLIDTYIGIHIRNVDVRNCVAGYGCLSHFLLAQGLIRRDVWRRGKWQPFLYSQVNLPIAKHLFVYENESESHRIARNGNHRFSRSGVAEE